MKIRNQNTDTLGSALERLSESVKDTLAAGTSAKAREAVSYYIALLKLTPEREVAVEATKYLRELTSVEKPELAQEVFYGLRNVAQWELPPRWDGLRFTLCDLLGPTLLTLLDEFEDKGILGELVDLIGWLGLEGAVSKFRKELENSDVRKELGPQVAYSLSLIFLFLRDRYGMNNDTINSRIESVVSWVNMNVQREEEPSLPLASLVLLLSRSGCETARVGLTKLLPLNKGEVLRGFATLGISSCPLRLEEKLELLKVGTISSLLNLSA